MASRTNTPSGCERLLARFSRGSGEGVALGGVSKAPIPEARMPRPEVLLLSTDPWPPACTHQGGSKICTPRLLPEQGLGRLHRD